MRIFIGVMNSHNIHKKYIDNLNKMSIIYIVGQRKSKSEYFKYIRSVSVIKEVIKMRMSDMIENFIKDLFEEEDYIEIQRNDLAEYFNCVPSQINYVISTRFKPSQGYYVESKRGGGGYISIRKVNITKSNYLMHIISNMGNQITAQEVDVFISNFLSYEIITKKEAKLLKVATSDNVLTVPQDTRDELRARIFKNMLVNLVED